MKRLALTFLQARNRMSQLVSDHAGQDMLEYALIAAFVATCAVALFPAIAMTNVRFNLVISAIDVVLRQTAQ